MNNTRLYIAIALLIMALFAQRACNTQKLQKLQSANSIMEMQFGELKGTMRAELNKKHDTIKSVIAASLADKAAFKKYADEAFALQRKMGNTIAFYKSNVQTRIDTFEIAFTKVDTVKLPVYITDSFARNNMVATPAYFAVDSPFYTIQGAVRQHGVNIYEVTLNDTITGRFVEGKKRWFKPRPIEYQVQNTNPYVNIAGTTSAVYNPKKKGPMGSILIGLLGFAAALIFGK